MPYGPPKFAALPLAALGPDPLPFAPGLGTPVPPPFFFILLLLIIIIIILSLFHVLARALSRIITITLAIVLPWW